MKPGDIVICRSKGLIGAGIRFAQRRMRKHYVNSPIANTEDKWWQWNHVAVIRKASGKDWLIYQAEAKGVTDDRLLSSVAPGGQYRVVKLPACVDREKFLKFLELQTGKKYGYLSILSCFVDMILPDAVCLRRSDTWICSGLVAAALWFAGFEPATVWPDVYTVVPAEIAESCSFNA
jgi:hypothetical protein